MTPTSTPSSVRPAARRAAFRPILVLLTAFLVISVAMEAALIVQSMNGGDVATAVWIRCSLVAGSAAVLLLIALFAARGSRSSWLRLRIIAPIVVLAVIVIVAIPGLLPDWVRLEQAVCGALVLPVAILALLPRMRAHFPSGA
ncbi:hypothetical protein [Leifsonia aquatica]|uniref:hypothetical protein n=1 Tax=Leifsonia aquatica TaxID=144185 RepID=UPI0004A7D72A|nr:hypothetical protein [Leifsonia aquatica]